jgi:hypothetical protein
VTRQRLGSRSRHTTTAFVCWVLGALIGILVVRAMINGAGTFVGGGRVTARTVFRTRTVDLRNVTKVKAVPDRGTRRLVLCGRTS